MPRFFTREGSTILHAGRPVAQIDPAKAVVALQALRGVSEALAAAIAAGALDRKMDAVATARRYGLVERVNTVEARKSGLVQ